MKITVAGLGYVGLSNAVLLAHHNEEFGIDTLPEKVSLINAKKSPIKDAQVERFFGESDLNLRATLDKQDAYTDADFVIIATPTDYHPETNYFNTQSIGSVIQDVSAINPSAVMVIKSTAPVGYTAKQQNPQLIFSPEYLREGKALYYNLYPSRIIIRKSQRAPKPLPICYSKAPLNKTLKFCLPTAPRPRLSSSLPTLIWPCVLPISTNWTPVRQCMTSTLSKSFKACAWTRG